MAETEDLPIVHVRRPGLPWRPEHGRTECGLPVTGQPVITREEFLEKLKMQGERRARVTTCQTCLDTARRWPSWEEDPVQCLARERDHWGTRGKYQELFRREVVALAVLAQRHRTEFEELLADQAATVPIAEGAAVRRGRRRLARRW